MDTNMFQIQYILYIARLKTYLTWAIISYHFLPEILLVNTLRSPDIVRFTGKGLDVIQLPS